MPADALHHTDCRVFTLRLSGLNPPPLAGKESIKDVKLCVQRATLSGQPASSHQDNMTGTRNYPFFMRMTAACVAACAVLASEYHGTVTTSGLPLPGLTVTALRLTRRW
jgi:hypothetical protein